MNLDYKFTTALDQVLELATLINNDMTQSLAKLGLTQSRTHLLWVLHQRGPATQKALADALRVSPRNITGLVDALVETGFVVREPHPDDRRATLLSFTPHGAEVMAQMQRDHVEFARLLFDAMPPAQFDCFTTGLAGVVEQLRTQITMAGKVSP